MPGGNNRIHALFKDAMLLKVHIPFFGSIPLLFSASKDFRRALSLGNSDRLSPGRKPLQKYITIVKIETICDKIEYYAIILILYPKMVKTPIQLIC